MVRSNPSFNDTAWMQNHAGEFYWTCDMCGVLYPAQTKCSQCPPRGPGGKGVVGSGKADFADQGKKGYGNQKGKHANQWQPDASGFGKATKGKGKAAYQWQQHNAANEWFIDQGTKNGSSRTGWQQQANQEHYQGQQAQQIQGVGPPNQRAADQGVHPDAFVRGGQQEQEQPPAPPIAKAGQPRQPEAWPQPQEKDAAPDQKLREADAISEPELVDEAVAAHQAATNPIRAESTRSRSAPYDTEERDQSPVRRRSSSRVRIASRSASPAPSTIPECYSVTSDLEDDYSRARSTTKLNKEIKDYRKAISKADADSSVIITLRNSRDKLSSIVFRRKSPKQREEVCTKRINALQANIDAKLESIHQDERNLIRFQDLRDQAVRDGETEVPDPARVERLYKELSEAAGIIDKLPQAKREDLIMRLREVQFKPASEASQEEARQHAPAASSRSRQESERTLHSTEARRGSLQSKDPERKDTDKRRAEEGNAMEVDSDGQGAPKVLAPKEYIGTPNFDQGLRTGDEKRGKEMSGHSMDHSPMGPTLPTTMSPQAFGPSTTIPLPPPPPQGKSVHGADQADAMAIRVEKMAQQKEKEKEQFKAVLKQKDDELAQIKERYQR